MIEKFAALGLSTTYNRVDEIETSIAKQICYQYQLEDLVRPPSLVKRVFTTSAIDNIDHNASSNTANRHFHGTGISLFQHLDTVGKEESLRYDFKKSSNLLNQTLELPRYYTDISPMAKVKGNPSIMSINIEDRKPGFKPIKESESWLK